MKNEIFKQESEQEGKIKATTIQPQQAGEREKSTDEWERDKSRAHIQSEVNQEESRHPSKNRSA